MLNGDITSAVRWYHAVQSIITVHIARSIMTLRLAAAQCIVIGPVCGFVCLCLCVCVCLCMCVCLSVCYHHNSKLRALILTNLGLQVKVVTISS